MSGYASLREVREVTEAGWPQPQGPAMTADSTVSLLAGPAEADGCVSVPFSVKNGTPSRKRPPQVLTRAEVSALMRQCSTRHPTGVRNRALIAVGYRTGLRCDETLALMPADIDQDASAVRVLHGKGDQARTVGIDPGGLDTVARWLDVRKDLGVPRNAPLFCTLAGGRVSGRYVRALMTRLGREAEIAKRVHFHGLRHTFAAELAQEGVSIDVIRKALGHNSLAVTDRYLRSIMPMDVIQATRSRTWDPDAPVTASPRAEAVTSPA